MSGSRSDSSHLPVMVTEVVEHLVTRPDGVYLDLTAGAGGHLRAFAEKSAGQARLYGLDRDQAAAAQATRNLRDLDQFRMIACSSYNRVDEVVEQFDDQTFDGILLDLGLSSTQLDDPGRGFSFRFDGPLDMRFDTESGGETAADLINRLSDGSLAEIIFKFGEERMAARLARAIVRERQKEMILTTARLSEIVRHTIRPPYQNKSLARVFQALRIAVNRELEQLSEVLPKVVALLNPGGRLAVISYHSLEDRIVKRFIQRQVKGCICPDGLAVCICGVKPSLKQITRRVLTPGAAEIESNPRSRSAKLRVAEKIG